MKINQDYFLSEITKALDLSFDKTIKDATSYQLYYAVSKSIIGLIWTNWSETREKFKNKETKEAYYFSSEFLMGRAMSNNLINLGIEKEVKTLLEELNFNYNEIEDSEPDPGLGNGGLGRLAACFLDSICTLELPVMAYGIRYRFGMFKQKIINGYQEELPDNWLDRDNPWFIKRPDYSVTVKFYGTVEVHKEKNGRVNYKRENTTDIMAIPFDMPILGYGTSCVNTLRLWEAKSPDGFDLKLFNDEQYLKAVEKSNTAEDLSRVLYPNDMGPLGKRLRLKQQYFFVSASLQDIVRKYKDKMGDDFSQFPKLVAIQLNDTHPAVAIPELMRIFLDKEELAWTDAWTLTTKTFAYTNHTILAEALETWSVDLFQSLLPRIYQILEEINRRFIDFLQKIYPGDCGKLARLSIINNRTIKMAWLAIIGSHSVNGVAALHSQILKEEILKEWYELYPNKFNNKTNGVTQRRWLLKSNPRLANWISDKIGLNWITQLNDLEKILKIPHKETLLKELEEIKCANKNDLAQFIYDQYNIVINKKSIFDVQIKRLHEYKRQVLNLFHILYLYNNIKKEKIRNMVPRTFFFGAKAASGYRMAKAIIKLINDVAQLINNDSEVNETIKIVFLENYGVSLAERIIPASDISEQISTAGKEASGTGNMKFTMNGALTVGTMDGANIEILEEVHENNIFIFGLSSKEIKQINMDHSYEPKTLLNSDEDLKSVLNMLIDGTFGDYDIYRELYDSIVYGIDGKRADPYFVLKDFRSYVKAQIRVEETFKDKKKWYSMVLENIARSGRFSSDRTIKEYASEIWEINSIKS